MARIPEDEIRRLKEEISIVRLVEARSIELKVYGQGNVVGRCPFHDDKTPSLVLTPDKNLWHCLGACNMGGSVIDQVMKSEGVSFRYAVELLRKDHISSAAFRTGTPIKNAKAHKLPPVVERDADDQKILNNVAAYYHQTAKESPEALKYLESRGLVSAEMLDYFQRNL